MTLNIEERLGEALSKAVSVGQDLIVEITVHSMEEYEKD